MHRLNNNIQRLLEQQMWQLVFLHISLYQADAENLRDWNFLQEAPYLITIEAAQASVGNFQEDEFPKVRF